MLEVSKKEFAEAMQVSKAMVSKYVKRGLPLTPSGRVDLVAGRTWVEENVNILPKGKSAQRSADGGDKNSETLNEARTRKESALASLHELELRVRKGELVEMSEIESAMGNIVADAQNGMLSLPGKVAPYVAVATDARECEEILDREVRQILNALSEHKLNAA